VNFQASHVRLDLFVSIVYSRLSTVLCPRSWSHITQVLPRKWIYREFWTQSGSTQCLVRSSVILNFKSDGTEKRAWRLAYSLTIDNFLDCVNFISRSTESGGLLGSLTALFPNPARKYFCHYWGENGSAQGFSLTIASRKPALLETNQERRRRQTRS
jgi:hypothetical protein